MTREEKIKNIIKGVEMAIENLRERGTLTDEMHAEIIKNMNDAVSAIK